jgi:XTP/dITP diphosphohydrolase
LPRLILLATSPRVAPGLLSLDAWHALESSQVRLSADLDEPLAHVCAEAGLPVGTVPVERAGELARELVTRARETDVVWIASPDGDPGLTDAIAAEVSSRSDPPDVEVLLGSWDVPGGRLLDVVAAMDRLRSPGGCPWDAEQTHASLAPYLVEEAHEALEAIESGDLHHLADELGDVLLQVVFHARVAQDSPEPEGFDIDDVAGHLVAKLVRRHPHVFADGDATSPEQVEAAWEEIKAVERSARGGADDDLLHGVPGSLPVDLAVAKVASRLRRRGLVVDRTAQAELDHAIADLAAAEQHARAALRRLTLSARPTAAADPEDLVHG